MIVIVKRSLVLSCVRGLIVVGFVKLCNFDDHVISSWLLQEVYNLIFGIQCWIDIINLHTHKYIYIKQIFFTFISFNLKKKILLGRV